MKKHIPNWLTISRLFAVPAAIRSWNKERKSAAVFFASYAIVSDILDGYLARKWKVKTPLGKKLDAAVDAVAWTALSITAIKKGVITAKQYLLHAVVFHALNRLCNKSAALLSALAVLGLGIIRNKK